MWRWRGYPSVNSPNTLSSISVTHLKLLVLMAQMHQTGTQPVLPVREPCLAAEWPPLGLRSSQNALVHLLKCKQKTQLPLHRWHLRGALKRNCLSLPRKLFPNLSLVRGRWCFRNQRVRKVKWIKTFYSLLIFSGYGPFLTDFLCSYAESDWESDKISSSSSKITKTDNQLQNTAEPLATVGPGKADWSFLVGLFCAHMSCTVV